MNKPLFVGLGALFFVVGVVSIRLLGPAIFTEGNPLLFVLFAVSFPVSWLPVKIGGVLGKVEGRAHLVAVVIMNTTALLLDGVALTWFQSIYGVPGPSLLLAAAWLLWTFGVGLLIALLTIRTDDAVRG